MGEGGKSEERLLDSAEKVQRMVSQTGELAIELIRGNREALRRCRKVSAADDVPQHAHSFLSVLIHYLGRQYLEKVLSRAVADLHEMDVEPSQADMASALKQQVANMAGKGTSANERLEAELGLLALVQQITQTVVLFQQHYHSELVREHAFFPSPKLLSHTHTLSLSSPSLSHSLTLTLPSTPILSTFCLLCLCRCPWRPH